MKDKFDELGIANDYFKNRLFLPAAKCYADIAEVLEKIGNFKEAEKIFYNIIECYIKEAEKNIGEKNYHEAAEIFLAAGELEKRLNEEKFSKDNYQKATQYLIKAAEKALDQNNFEDAGDYYKKVAILLEDEIQDRNSAITFYKNAIDSYQKIINQNIKSKDFKKAAQIIQYTAILYENIENYEKAIEIDKKGLELAMKKEFTQIVTDCYLHMANCFLKINKKNELINILKVGKDYNIEIANSKMNKKNYIEAAECFDNAILILEETLNVSEENTLLLQEMKQLRINKIECYLRIAELYLKINDIDRAAHFQRNAALCYRLMNEHKKAAEMFLEAGKNFEIFKNEKLASINFRDAGFQYELINEPLIAANLLSKAGKLARIEGPSEMSLECYRATLKNYEFIENIVKFEETLVEIEECLKLLVTQEETEQNYHIAASYLFEIGSYYDFLGKLNKTETYYNDAVNLFEKSVELAIKDNQLTIAAYSLSCFVILKLILNDIKGVELNLEKYRKALGKIKYFEFSEDIFKAYSFENKNISEVLDKYDYLIKHSDELNLLTLKLREKIKN